MESISFLLLLVISATAEVERQHYKTYIQPYEAAQLMQNMSKTAAEFTDADWRRITDLANSMTPLAVLRQHTKGSLSDSCAEQTLFMLETLDGGYIGGDKTWALDMVDAWGKPSAGIMRLALSWLGSFSECRSIVSNVTDIDSTLVNPVEFEGKYCGVGTPVGSDTVNVFFAPGINVGGCFPSGCSEADVHVMVTSLLGSNSTVGVQCQETTLPLSDAAIATIVLYCVVAAICLLATLYEFWYIMTEPKVKVTTADDCAAVNADTEGDDVEVLIPPAAPAAQRKPGVLGEFLMCFSIYTNGCRLLGTKQPPGSLTCIHGIRFISMLWVILGHTIVFSIGSIENILTIYEWFRLWTFQVVVNAPVAVDTFFMISGLLTTYLLLKDLQKKHQGIVKFLISVPVMYLHRYIRLTPAYGFMILFYACLTLYMYNSPLKPTHTTIADVNCVDYWWTNILYVNNVVQPVKACAAWTWYLADDFQFYLITPFVVYLMHMVPVAGLVLSILMIIASVGASIGVSVRDDLGVTSFAGRNSSTVDVQEIMDYLEHYYYAPYTRYQSFGVGILFGYILYHCKGQLPIHRVANLALWAISSAVLLAIVYGPWHLEDGSRVMSVAEAAMYNGFAKTGWSLALGYIILACCTGRGGWVNDLLSWSGFVPLSKMTYCAYLVHPVVITIISASHQNKVIWNKCTYAYMFAAYSSLAFAVAFVFSLMFEVPFMHLDKKYLTGKLKKAKPE